MKNNKNYDFAGLFDGNISKLLIGLLGVSVLALVLYFGISLTGKGTFSASSDFNFWDYEFEESTGESGFKCYVGSRRIAEIVYVLGSDNNGPYGVLTTNSPSRFILSGNIITGYDISGWNVGKDGPSHRQYFTEGTLKNPNSWECKLTDDLTDSSNYMCDNYGQVAYVPLCRKYTSESSDGNLILSTESNANTVYCGRTGYYLYTLAELSEPSTCMRMPDGRTTSFAVGSGKTVNGVKMCIPSKGVVSEFTSCNSSGTCYDNVVYERGSFEADPVVLDDNTTISFAPSGYEWSTLKEADDPACTFKKCYKCEQQGDTILATSDTPTVTSVPSTTDCPEGSTEEEITSCYKSCIYCSDGEIQTQSVYIGRACTGGNGMYEDTPENRSSIDCAHYTGPGTGPTPTYTESVTCYRCSPTQEEQLFTNTTTCPAGWIEGNINCSGSDPGNNPGNTTLKDCYSCYNGELLHDMLTACTGEWSETRPNCSNNSNSTTTTTNTTKKTCYYCSGESRLSFQLEDSANGDCSKSSLHSGAVADSGLTCFDNSKRCYNDPNKSVGEWVKVVSCDGNGNAGYCTLSDGRVVSRSTITESYGCNVDSNSQTGSTAITIAWIIGLTAIGYAFYYFRQTNVKEN